MGSDRSSREATRVLYRAIRLGCNLYHEKAGSYKDAYGAYLRSRDAAKWDSPERLNEIEVGKLIAFANRWSCRDASDMETRN